jgi:hypothetical protein
MIGMSLLSTLLAAIPSVKKEIVRIFGDGYIEFRGYGEEGETAGLLWSTLVAGCPYLSFTILIGSLGIPIAVAHQEIDQRMEMAQLIYLTESEGRFNLFQLNQSMNR